MKLEDIHVGRRYRVRFGPAEAVLTCEAHMNHQSIARLLMYEEVGEVQGDRVVPVRRYAEHVSPQQVLQEVD